MDKSLKALSTTRVLLDDVQVQVVADGERHGSVSEFVLGFLQAGQRVDGVRGHVVEDAAAGHVVHTDDLVVVVAAHDCSSKAPCTDVHKLPVHRRVPDQTLYMQIQL